MPEAKQNTSKLAEMFARASIFTALVGIAVDVVRLSMALLSFRGFDTPSLPAQGEQRRSSFFPPGHSAMTDVDTYWRTRCVGEAIDQGYTFLRLTCECGRITDYPFTLLLQRKGVSRESFIGNIRFRCKNCGGKEIKIGVRSQAPPLTP